MDRCSDPILRGVIWGIPFPISPTLAYLVGKIVAPRACSWDIVTKMQRLETCVYHACCGCMLPKNKYIMHVADAEGSPGGNFSILYNNLHVFYRNIQQNFFFTK